MIRPPLLTVVLILAIDAIGQVAVSPDGTVERSGSARVAPAGQDALERIKQSHARGLNALSRSAQQKDVLNDAERLLYEARRWAPGAEDIKPRRAEIQSRRVELAGREKSAEHRGFLRSPEYAEIRRKLLRAESKLKANTTRALLGLIRAHLRDGDQSVVSAAAEAAHTLGQSSEKLRALLGKKRSDAAAARRRKVGLPQLKLGEVVAGQEVTLGDLAGKVVLWRSFSL